MYMSKEKIFIKTCLADINILAKISLRVFSGKMRTHVSIEDGTKISEVNSKNFKYLSTVQNSCQQAARLNRELLHHAHFGQNPIKSRKPLTPLY